MIQTIFNYIIIAVIVICFSVVLITVSTGLWTRFKIGKLTKFKLFLMLRNDKTSPEVDAVLNRIIKTGIEEITVSAHKIMITDKLGLKYTLWNGNKYYAWLNQGSMYSSSNDLIFQWNYLMPSNRMMKKFHDFLMENKVDIHVNRTTSINDILNAT